MYWVRKSLAT